MQNLGRPDAVPPVQKVQDGGRRPERVEDLSLRPGKRLFAHVDLLSDMQCCHFGAPYDVECRWPLAKLSKSGHEGQRVHRICNLAPVLRITKEWSTMSNYGSL